MTNLEDKICDNHLTNETSDDRENEQVPIDNSKQITNKILSKPDLKFVSNPVTWQQMSPKKEKKSSSSSGSSDCSSSGESQHSGLKTWATIKKTSVENMELKSNSNSGHSSSTSSSSSGGSPTRTWSSIRQENKNNTLNRKDGSPTKRPLSVDSQDNEVILKNLENSADRKITKTEEKMGLDNSSFSSNNSPVHSEKKFFRKTELGDCDNSSTSLPIGGTSQEEGWNNDYFYDEDFTVQFDSNLRESTPALNLNSAEQTSDVEFPNMVTGSYLSFKNVKSSGIVVHEGNELFCPDESEISCSRHSNMEVSTSEREMMCSSDMLDFSDNPLFTPPLSGDVHMVSQEDSTDSLDKVNKDKGRMDLSVSHTSSDGNLNLDCFPRKEEYFLSFDGSQGHTESYSEQSNSMNSNCSSQGQTGYNPNHVNVCSNDDMGEESSESFHICMSGNTFLKKPQVGNRLAKFQTLTALQEQTNELSASSEYSDEKPCSEPVTSPTKRTFRKLSPTKGKQLRFAPKMCFACHLNNSTPEGQSSPSRSRSKQKPTTSWKQVKSLKKLGKLDNILDASRSRSMPDICLHTWQSGSSLSCHGHDIQKIAESFHCKRHSAYLLDLYQRVRNQSNPVSPECMSNIEQILFHNVICRDIKLGNSSHHCEFCHDSNSSNTMVNSHQITKDGKRGYYNQKRILDWLEKDKLENKIHRSCQTESLMKTKDTVVSPTTVTLWGGTKNFASQFPPSAKDCAIQTAVHELMDNTQDCEQQTTPTLEGKSIVPKTIVKDKVLTSSKSDKKQKPYHSLDKSDILKLISHDFKEIDNLLPQISNVKAKTGAMPRSKSADSANRKQRPQAGLETKSLYYSHKSLPDLGFIELKHHEERLDDGSSISLFDPLPIAMPVPVFIPTVVDSNKVTKSLSTKTSIDNLVHCCRSNSKCRVKGHRSHSAPARSHNSNLIRQTESPSSSSGFTSSTSSGIDPGYSDKCFHNGSPTNDIERLIFYPPHVENTQKGDYISENLSDSGNISLPSQSEKPKKQCKPSKPAEKKVKQYVNEIHPGNVDKKAKQKVVRSPNSTSNVSHSSSGSSLHLEHLYALQEEQTPVSSPERDLCHHESEYLSGNALCVHCCTGQGQGHVEGWENEEVVIRRRKFDYHIQLSSESGSSGSGSFFPNFDKKPLKSCLRKKQFLRSRSLSDPYELIQGDQNREKLRKNRHSYAYEEIVLLQDENGEYFLCKNDEDDEDDPVVLYIEEKTKEDENATVVKLRPKSNEKDSNTDSSEKELSGKRKSVSFASEVSFHAISPHMSPKRQHGNGDKEEGASSDQLENVVSDKQEVMSSDVQTDTKIVMAPKTDDEHESASDEAPPTEFKVSPTGEINPDNDKEETTVEHVKDQRKALLSEISSAAESLVEHFVSAKNPFDKLRLGSSEDTPEIGDLVLSRLCPAICNVINEGLKSHLAGVQVFGRVQVTAWKLAEASVEQGPYTRAIHDLVQQIKGHSGLVAHSNKFDAFVFGLLNLRLLDYWLGYLKHNTSIVEKYYNSDSVMSLSGTLYERQFSEVLISLQPLAVLPFQLSIDYITSRLSMQGSETTSTVKDGSPKNDIVPAEKCMTDSFSKEKAIIGVAASKAWDWLKNGAAPKSPNDETSSPALFTGNVMISSITGMLGKISGSSKLDNKKGMDSQKKNDADEVKSTKDSDRPIMAAGLVNDVQGEMAPAKPPRMHLDLELPVNEVENGVSAVVDSKEEIPRKQSGDNSTRSLTYEDNSMLSSFSGMAQKLLGIKAENVEKNETMNKKAESVKTVQEKKEVESENKPLVVLRPKKPESSEAESEKNKSGLIRLFDKLLLPRDSSKKEQKLKSRWSWGYGQGQQMKTDSTGNKNVPIKNDAKPSALPLQSKVPQYGKVSGVQSRSSIATVPSKLVTRSQTMKNSGLSLKNTESSSSKSSTSGLQERPKDHSSKIPKDRPLVKSKVPVRKVTSQKIQKEQPKSSDHKTDRVPKNPENKWQGGVTLSASLEEGPTLIAPPSVTQKVFVNKEEKKTEEKPKLDTVVKPINKRRLNSDNIESRLTYQDAMTTDGSENPLHLSDEINCNSPSHNGTMTFNLNDTEKTADTGFRKPNFRFVKTIVSSDQSDFSYEAGDHFETLAQLDSDWMYCINGKKEGLIRIEHLKPLTDEDCKTS